MRYLDKEQLTTNLKLGKSIEQWLGSQNEQDYNILKWIRIDKEKTTEYSLLYFEVFDDGDDKTFDVYEFEPVDPDAQFGIINTFDSIDDLLEFAKNNYMVSENKFVNSGVLQEEYKNYREEMM
ncbi:MAG: hypothetical protein JHD28_03535 [Bacteroidia bacterium]|nr:hypothetical protein [Bacteroidia bacterium]